MIKKKTFKILGYLSFLFLLIPLTTSCQKKEETPSYREHPRFYLEGTKESSDALFDYYSIGNDEYAVSLKESIKTDNNGLIVVPEEYNGYPVTGIWRNAFTGSKSTSITLTNNITVIDYEAFLGSNIAAITIPYSIDLIGDGAFYSCSNLTSVRFENSNRSSFGSAACSCSGEIDTETEYEYCSLREIPAFCFFKCNAMTELMLPSSIEEIQIEAFNGCVSLASALSFQNIKAIRSRAFQGCASLKTVYFPQIFFTENGVIEPHAFNYCNTEENMKFYFAGTTSVIEDWVANNPNWGWYSDITNPASSSYSYTITDGNTYYTDDWIYTTSNNEVSISSYIGPTTSEVTFLSIPDYLPIGSENRVTSIDVNAFNSVKTQLVRLYLPTGLKRIHNNMFSDYTNLIVIDDNTACVTDEALIESGGSLVPRVNLSKITGLQVIGDKAFSLLPNARNIKSLHLPYSLLAVGTQAFGNSGNSSQQFYGVDDFKWDFNENLSALEIIGHDAFYNLGHGSGSTDFADGFHRNHIANNGSIQYNLTTLVFPKTFRGFGITSSDKTKFDLSENPTATAAHFFAGSPLLHKVYFKGGSENETTNLILGIQTFVFNESLQTIVFEERENHVITFHDEAGKWAQPCIGSNAGRAKNDFRGDPALQTIVLPNVSTQLNMQKVSFQGNSRAVIYLSGTLNTNMYNVTNNAILTVAANPTNNRNAISNATLWRSIGNEEFFDSGENNSIKGYIGYCFGSNASTESSNISNLYGINQEIPVYENVHYLETVDEPENGIDEVTIEVGRGKTNELVIEDKFAFVCNNTTHKATLSKYLYDRWDENFSGTAIVPKSVENYSGVECEVNKVGASCFSAAFCDLTNQSYPSNKFKELSGVSLPDSISEIGEYAFMRAYGITNVSSYHYDNNVYVYNGDYVMPSSLTYINKHAFAFCGIVKVLKIPNNCLFYENTHSTTYETSVFSNDFHLRQITFGNNQTSSTYYSTTTYTNASGNTCTSALYSTNDTSVSYNKNCLLLVLYRDSADKGKTSADVTTVGTNKGKFDGNYKTNPFLYGAFKMGYWIDTLIFGTATKDASNNTLRQAIFSGIYNVSSNRDSYIYLYKANNFATITCDLTTISIEGNFEGLPAYAFDGCEQFTTFELPRIEGATIPDGLFANTASGLQFKVPTNISGSPMTTSASGVVDLTYCGYAGIGDNLFNNSTLVTSFTAPITPSGVSGFTIGSGAFAGCNNLTTIDLSNVTGTLTIESEAFANSKVSSITWPTNASTEVIIKSKAFYNCDYLTSVTLHAKTSKIGVSAFEECNNLATFSATGNLTSLTEIEARAFYNCTSLTGFDFSKFTALTTIGDSAFQMGSYAASKIISTGGVINFPATLSYVGANAFANTGITKLYFASSAINLRSNAFRYCSNLSGVYFTNPDCTWTLNNNNYDFFSNSSALTTLFIPKGLTLNNSVPHSYVWTSPNVIIYTHTTLASVSSITLTDPWREHTSGQYATIVFYAEYSTDLLNASYQIIDSNTQFWAFDPSYPGDVDHAILLGKAVSVDGSTHAVTFSSGYVLAVDGTLTAPTP